MFSSVLAMEEVVAPVATTNAGQRNNRNPMLRSQSVPAMKATESIADLRTYMSKEVAKQEQAKKDAEELQVRINNIFHSATGLDTDKGPLRHHDDSKVKESFDKAKQLLIDGAEINWGYSLVNLLLAFKLREEHYIREEYSTHYGHTSWNNRIIYDYHTARDVAMFGEGHAFLAWLIDNGADVNKAWPENDVSRFMQYVGDYVKEENGAYRYKEWKSRADVARKAKNIVPLRYALEVCREGCCVNKLLQAGAKLYSGALSEAFHSANPSSALLLIAKDASLDEKDQAGNTPAHWAVQAEFKTKEERLAVLNALRERGALFSHSNGKMRTPLHEAFSGETLSDLNGTYRVDCLKEDTSALQFLLDQTIDINAQDEDGRTVLFEVVAKESRAYFNAKRQIALGKPGFSREREAQIMDELFQKNNLQDLYAQNTALVKMLVDKRADCSIAQNEGVTPLHVAVLRGMEDCVRIFVTEGRAPVNAQDRDFLTPLQYVAVAKIPVAHKTMIIKYLMEAGADPEIADREGNTPLMNAALQGNTDGVELLLAFGANPKTTNLKTFTIKEAVKKAGNCYSKDSLLNLVKEYKKGTRKPHFTPLNKEEVEAVN